MILYIILEYEPVTFRNNVHIFLKNIKKLCSYIILFIKNRYNQHFKVKKSYFRKFLIFLLLFRKIIDVKLFKILIHKHYLRK